MAAWRLPDRRPALIPASAESWAATLGRLVGRQWRAEWFGSPPHQWLISRPRPDGLAAAPRDFRPADIERGRLALAGSFAFDGLEQNAGPGSTVWDRAAPSRAFAVQLHRMDWLRDLMASGEAGPRTALHYIQSWDKVFGVWNGFSWSAACLSRRTFNLACNLKRLVAQAPDQDDALLDLLARHARHLLLLNDGPRWAAERAVSAAVAGSVLAGRAGERVMARALAKLEPALKAAVLADGGHASRSPEAGMELLLDLLTLDDALLQLGRPPPEELTRAIDRLGAALRYFTLPDGRLASFQGGEQSQPDRVIAAAAFGDSERPQEPELAPPPSPSAPHSGYEKLIGRRLSVIVDAAPPARGDQPEPVTRRSRPARISSARGWAQAVELQSPRAGGAASTITDKRRPINFS